VNDERQEERRSDRSDISDFSDPSDTAGEDKSPLTPLFQRGNNSLDSRPRAKDTGFRIKPPINGIGTGRNDGLLTTRS